MHGLTLVHGRTAGQCHFYHFQELWEANKEPLIAFLEEAGRAQRGIVVDQVGGINFLVRGDIFRMADLLPMQWWWLRARTKTF